ncbi:MAG: tetratricopeptide repeat protein [Candidatus Krumholzibacteriia bacterium]
MQGERRCAGAARPAPRTPRRHGRWAAAAWGLAGLVVLGPPAGAAATGPDLPPPAALPATAAAESLLARGDLSLGRGEADLALRCFREAAVRPELAAPAAYGEARALLALGQVDRACRLLRDLRDAPAGADTSAAARDLTAAAAGLLGRTYLQLGRADDARAVFLDLARSFPDERDWATVMVGRSYQNEAAWRDAFVAIRPLLREGRYMPAYDLALAIYWNLDAGAQRELSGLLRGFLGARAPEIAGGGR